MSNRRRRLIRDREKLRLHNEGIALLDGIFNQPGGRPLESKTGKGFPDAKKRPKAREPELRRTQIEPPVQYGSRFTSSTRRPKRRRVAATQGRQALQARLMQLRIGEKEQAYRAAKAEQARIRAAVVAAIKKERRRRAAA